MKPLVDSFGREITYLRLSVTDRCDLRCNYCMAEKMTFLPRKDLLSLEELETLSAAFIARGVRKIRITGGEPLVRRDIMKLIKGLGAYRDAGALDEITVTTNGTQLHKYAKDLKAYGVERINVSLDTFDAQKFAALTRRDALDQVLRGLDAAQDAGLAVKINAVALKGVNDVDIADMVRRVHALDMELTLIEVMPLGVIDGDRVDQYVPLTEIRERLESVFTLIDSSKRTGGPARYVRIKETGGTLGFISPLTNNFCAGCNRVRVTCTGQIYMCLGHSEKLDLRAALRSETPDAELEAALDLAMRTKPEKHFFDIKDRGAAPAVSRHMSVTGG